tara:strand:- start:131 stop:439 length:309 start_codon:yes stop_codon:yes gene_type:complete
MIAEQIGEDQESILIGLAADKAKTPQEQALWANIAKKFNGLNLRSISIACVGLAMWIGSPNEAIAQCALCVLMLSAISITAIDRFINSLTFERVNHEVSRND